MGWRGGGGGSGGGRGGGRGCDSGIGGGIRRGVCGRDSGGGGARIKDSRRILDRV